MTESLLALSGVSRSYVRGSSHLHALRDVTAAVYPGELLALVGPSGSGKSTLLSLLAGWEVPDAGEISVNTSLSAGTVVRLPWRDLAVVPQSLGLLEELTVAENVTLPARLDGTEAVGAYEERATALLSRLDLESLAERRPSEVSLGEQQRAALARALLLGPQILLVDEPTTHQDRRHADRVFEELHRAAADGAVVLAATHDQEILDHADRILELRDGTGSWRC